MGKNYDAMHYINDRFTGCNDKMITALQRLFNIEDSLKECQGCVIDSVVAFLILKHFGVKSEIRLGEVCADNYHWFYHCWLLADKGVIDFGIYGNSKYNPLFRGPILNTPVIFDIPCNIKYRNGSDDEFCFWMSDISGVSLSRYAKECPNNRVFKLFCKAMDVSENTKSKELFDSLTEGECFPKIR